MTATPLLFSCGALLDIHDPDGPLADASPVDDATTDGATSLPDAPTEATLGDAADAADEGSEAAADAVAFLDAPVDTGGDDASDAGGDAPDAPLDAGDAADGEALDAPGTANPPGPDLIWQNLATGEVYAWQITGSDVSSQIHWTGPTALGFEPVDTFENTILWYEPQGGHLWVWGLGPGDALASGPPFSWQCTLDSGCTAQWRPIGRLAQAGFGGTAPLLWHDADSGELSLWVMEQSVVVEAQPLSRSCGASDGCSAEWRAVLTADFDDDGNTDVLWQSAKTGELTVWLLDGVKVKGTQTVSWLCGHLTDCATTTILAAADVNADGHVDLTWLDSVSGDVTRWLLDGHGNVTGTSTLSTHCASSTNCPQTWKAVGYLRLASLHDPLSGP